METTLANQSAELVYAKEELLIAFVKAAFPTLDLTPGTVIRDLVIRLYAHLEVRMQEQIDTALIANSLLEISKNPNVIDEVQVDRLLSNYNITRSSGNTATGKLRLFFTDSTTTVIDATTSITINDVVFQPTQGYILVNAANYTAGANQRLLTASGATYTAVIDITAVEPGSIANQRSGALVSAISPSPGTFISARADADLVGGADAEDNVALLAKLKTGVVGKVFGGREHIRAKLKDKYPGILDVGCVGFLDPEMRRDLVNGVHVGGRIDLFVKSASYPARIQEQVVPKFISWDTTTQEALFEITIPTSAAAGLYVVENIRSLLTQLGSLEILSDTRTLLEAGQHLLTDPKTNAFSAFQQVVIRFYVPWANLLEAWSRTGAHPIYAIWATTVLPFINDYPNNPYYKFYLEYLKLPDLVEIQSYVDSASERSLSADIMVHAPVPILCSIQLRLLKQAGAPTADLVKVKAAIAAKFNSYGFGATIPGSALIHVAYNNLPEGYTVDLPMHMYGVVINPDLSEDVMFSADALKPPTNYVKGVSPNTVAFYLESNMIDVSIKEC